MKQYALLADSDLCVGCYACVVACKQENNLPEGLRYINISIDEEVDGNGELRLDFVPVHCVHCAEAVCIASCTELAITKRGDGIVVLDEAMCTGCGLCVEACPVGAIQIDPRSGSASMCHMCHHRIEKGLEPACSMHCFTKAIKFGLREDFATADPGQKVKCAINCKFFEEFRGRK